MSNLALNKLPLENQDWKRPEEATNGKTLNYDGKNGFAYASWPCTYTIDLGSEMQVHTIRFLLWDNLGFPNNAIDSRKYKFSISISSDGQNYFQIFTNENGEGGNGWFSFTLTNQTYVRFIKLNGHYNSNNKQFHIVEFEIHDTEPAKLSVSNIKSYSIPTIIPTENKINELIDKSISDKSKVFEGIEDKFRALDDTIVKSRQALEQIEFIKHTHDFLTESIRNKKRSYFWLGASGIIFVVFILVLINFMFKDNYAIELIKRTAGNELLAPFITTILGAYYVSKALLLSTLLFVFGWFLKNYRSERHNYVMNKHKAISLTVATGILTKDDYKNANREVIFSQGMEIIFSHQTSGFSKDDGTSPSVVNTLLNKSIPGFNV